MTESSDINERIDSLTGAIRELARTREDANPAAKAADGGRYAAALDGSKDIADRLVALERQAESLRQSKANDTRQSEINDAVQTAVKAALAGVKTPSMAQLIGSNGGTVTASESRMIRQALTPAFPTLKAAFRDYESGELFSGILGLRDAARNMDMDLANQSKAILAGLGVQRADAPSGGAVSGYLASNESVGGWGKATLGATGATGGYVLPNNLVDTLVKPAVQEAVLQNLVTVINGVAVRGVDQPYRLGAPTRMTFQDWGTTKENVNETYGSYTSTLATMARILDIGKQYARFSAGAAEQDVMDELTKAAILGENYYMIAGAGTGSVGVGDPTVGVYTSLNATPTFLGYKGAFSGASNSTVAGSFANACISIMASLASRNRRASAIVVDSTTFFTAIGQGSDTAGFWVSPTGGPTGFTRTQSGGLAFWGVPIYYDTNLGTEATTKIAIGAEWSAFKLFRGLEFRIDSSDVAGTRWDQNLIGFRGEEEFGFNAETPVHVGAAQLLTSVIP